MRVLLRADASARIGLGHLRRCLSLAQALRAQGAQCHFVCRDLGLDVAALVAAEGFGCSLLPAPAPGFMPAPDQAPHAAWAGLPQADDAAQTIEAARPLQPDWLVVDHYAFDQRWHGPVAAALGCAIAAIDDLADRPLQVDLLLDHNLADDHATKYAGRLPAGTPACTGPGHALLGPAYAGATPCMVQEAVHSIGIFMGGTDAAGLSQRALQACTLAGFQGPVEVAASSAFVHLAALRQAVATRPHTTLLLDQPDLAGFFGRHGLQIGAGGGATWERCCLGAPTLAVAVAANQQQALQPLAARQVLQLVAGTAPDQTPDASAIASALAGLLASSALRRRLAAAARGLVDGQGAARVAATMQRLALTLRPATMDDARLLLGWRNDAATRQASHGSAPVAWPDHQRWLAAVLADPRRQLWLACLGDEPVGTVRADAPAADAPGAPDAAQVLSWTVAPAARGRGLGARMVRQLAARLPGPLRAEVREGNTASVRVARAAGLVPAGRQGEVLHFRRG